MDEYIRREEARELMYQKQAPLTEYDLDSIPAVDVVEVVHGRWIHRKNWDKWVCSECSSEEDRPRQYCPECGARMDTK